MMTLAVYRVNRETGKRTTVRERETVTGDGPLPAYSRFPVCTCPSCRGPVGATAARAPRSAWGAYLDHTCTCAPCQVADAPSGQCDTARALYEAARVEARR